MRLRIADNHIRRISKDLQGDSSDEEHALNLLKPIANTTINTLLSDNPSLLVFPASLGCSIDTQRVICSTYQNAESAWIETNNIMGFVGSSSCELAIHSRFHERQEDFFLHYMLQKVFDINILDVNYSSDKENIWEFLIYLFPHFLKKALTQGLYKEYVHKKYNDINVRGSIDINRHIKRNVPFNGRVAYNVREYSYDNSITQLVRHTIHYISLHKHASNILFNDADTQNAVQQIKDCTPSFCIRGRETVIGNNRIPFTHPYYTEYSVLQQLCMSILRQDTLSYGDDDDEIYGLLFDGAWLWEEYLATFLVDYKHPDNRSGKGSIKLFDNKKGVIYPDFYKLKDSKVANVIDAKYKRMGNENREDYYQLITYMYRLNSANGCLLYPRETKSEKDIEILEEKLSLSSSLVTPAIETSVVHKVGLPIPTCSESYDEFREKMEELEEVLKLQLE